MTNITKARYKNKKSIYYKYNKNYKKLLQIRKASNIDITKLQIIITKVGATNEQTNENKTNKASHYHLIIIIS